MARRGYPAAGVAFACRVVRPLRDGVHAVSRRDALDGDGSACPAVGQRDPVVADLQQNCPGLRPVGFWSPVRGRGFADQTPLDTGPIAATYLTNATDCLKVCDSEHQKRLQSTVHVRCDPLEDPVFDLAAADLLTAFKRELDLCKLTTGEHVVVLAEPTSRGDYVTAAYAAAQACGAHVLVATVPGGSPAPLPSTHTGAGPGLESVLNDRVAQELLKSADLVVDLTREGFIHAPVQNEILAAGTRIIFVCDAPEVLIRNLPKEEDKARVLQGVELLRRSTTMQITSVHGTDLSIQLAGAEPMFQTGFADDPGRWDHWPSTMVMCWPALSDGVITLAPGDILLPFKEYVREPVKLRVKDGTIVDISGGADARLLETFFADFDDRWGRSLSHMGWGLMETADWFATALYGKDDLMGMDARAFAGNFLWSTGPHPVLQRESFAHVDIAMRGCTVTVDDTTVVRDGKLMKY
jgi:2,5-dihydroxypyridine 5,6-dioxygenase